ncbi:MAG: single-stranded DNA-binding protein [Oscillospiraceae bacterium]|nr:single-stranded DNA-binding protein [Oscillospiraceae bacterium]
MGGYLNIVFHHEEEVERMEQRLLQHESNNRVLLRGILLDPPEFSHENHGKRFDSLLLSVQRLSGAFDHLPVIAEHELVSGLDPLEGPMVEVTGQIRSYNNRSGQGRRLVISVYAETLHHCGGEPENQVQLTGTICRDPVYRRTPLGREISDVMLAVERKYRRKDYVPCILWGSVARMASECEKGDTLYIQGRLQSRLYTKQTETGAEERTAYELSAITAERLY